MTRNVCSSFRVLSVAVLILSLTAPILFGRQETQQAPESTESTTGEGAQSPLPVFRSDINFVRVDAIVTDDDGNPVFDLKVDDFEIFEDGSLQTIESFKLVRVTGIPEPDAEPARPILSVYDEEREAAREDTRLFVIFLDDYHVRRGGSLAVRRPILSFLENLGPLDMVAVMYPLTPISDLRFTRDHASTIQAIRQFDGRKFDYTPRNQFEANYSMYPSTVVEQIRNEVSLTGLRALVTHLGGLREGRKSVIVVSEGYSNMLPAQLREEIAGFRGTGPGVGGMGLESAAEDTARFFSEADLQFELRQVYDAANRSNTSLYTLDPRRLGAFEFDINERVGFRVDQDFMRMTADTLRVLADQTDGRAIVNQNDLAGGLRQVIRDTSFYYLIGYTSSESPTDGEFHPIEVKVSRSGVNVRARRGYWALTSKDVARITSPSEPELDHEMAGALEEIEQTRRGRVVRTWLSTSRGKNGKTRVAFVWEPMPNSFGSRPDPPVRVSLTALDQDNRLCFRGHVPDVDLESLGSRLSGKVVSRDSRGPHQVMFDAVPGKVQLRFSVEGAEGQVLDNVVQEILVPDFSVPVVALSTPVIVRARNVVELRSLKSDLDAVPSPGREFNRIEHVLVRFEVYSSDAERSQPSVVLLNRRGESIIDLPVSLHAGVVDMHQVEVPLTGLAPGEYLVEIRVASYGEDVRKLIAFRVAG